jgi:hypothetical protein
MGITCGCIPMKGNESKNYLSFDNITKENFNKEIFDFKKHSQLVWVCINDIRINPKKYSELLLDILSLLKNNKEKGEIENKNIQNTNNFITDYDENPRTSLKEFLSSFLQSNDEMHSILQELVSKFETLSSKEIKSIEYENELYEAIDHYYNSNNNINNNNNNIDNNNNNISPSSIFSIAMNKNLKAIEYEINNYTQPEITIWKILLDNKEKTDEIISNDYIKGIAYSFCEDNNLNNFRTKIYFLYEVKIKDVIINGINPLSGVYLPLKLDEPFFKDISYKDKIIGGSYVYIEDGINVEFFLYNGEKVEENIKLNE